MSNPVLQGRLALFPGTTQIAGTDPPALRVAGCDLERLVEEYGSPLYLYDEDEMAAAVSAYRQALDRWYPGAWGLTYAGKALLNLEIARWMADQGLWVDCTGQGEIYIARQAGVPRAQLLVHGVNKSPADLDAALDAGGVIVVDNLTELERIQAMRMSERALPELWLRYRPGQAVTTHAYRQTGQADSKFGMSLQECAAAVRYGLEHSLPVKGLHFHQGSHFHDPEEVVSGLEAALTLLAGLRDNLGWTAEVLSPGGGWGAPQHESELPHPPLGAYVERISLAVVEGCEQRGLPLPRLQLEPGRSLVARAGVAIYRIGVVKQAGQRRWILVDGGMADNIRPALYGATYTALPVSDPLGRPLAPTDAWLAGPYCESGDVLIRDLPMPELAPGELVAIPVSGAYQLMMASNYNGALRPAVLLLRQGQVRVIQRRETPQDLLLRDRPLRSKKGGGP